VSDSFQDFEGNSEESFEKSEFTVGFASIVVSLKVKMYKNGAGWWLGILGLGGVQTNPSSPFNKKLML